MNLLMFYGKRLKEANMSPQEKIQDNSKFKCIMEARTRSICESSGFVKKWSS
jgi:hypothetical protein